MGAGEHEQTAISQPTRSGSRLAVQISGLVTVIFLLISALFPLTWPVVAIRRSSPLTRVAVTGSVQFHSSGQLDPASETGLNDQVTVSVMGLSQPQAGNSDYVWLLPDSGQVESPSLLLGTLPVQTGKTAQLGYSNPEHIDLLARFSQLLITEEPSSPPPLLPSLNPGAWRARGSIPDIPNPAAPNHYRFLDHVRHLLAQDPDLQHIGLGGGLASWLARNSEKLLEWASAARDEWGQTGAVDALRRQIVRILDYLDGVNDVWRDVPAGMPFLADLPAGRIGLLEQNPLQNPPAYLTHVAIHLNGLVHAPSASAGQRQLAAQINAALQQVTTLMQTMHSEAVQLVHLSDSQLGDPSALTALNALVTNATVAFAGQPGDTAANQQGVDWICHAVASFAFMTLGPP